MTHLTRRTSVPRRLSAHLFELTTALVWAIVGTAYLTDPDVVTRSPVGDDVAAPLWTAWSTLELLGGLTLAASILIGDTRWRFAGLAVLATGLLMHGLASIWTGAELRDINYFLFAGTCGLRALLLARWNSRAASA